jgi:hypothetical protein
MTARQYAMFKYFQSRGMTDEKHARTLRQRTLGSLVKNGWLCVSWDLSFAVTSQGILAADKVKDLHRESIHGWSKYVWDKDRDHVVKSATLATPVIPKRLLNVA